MKLNRKWAELNFTCLNEMILITWRDINGIKPKCDEVSWHLAKKWQGQSTISGGDYWKKWSHFIFVTQWLWILTEVVTKSNVVLLIFTGEWFDQFWVRQAGENDSNSSKEITVVLFVSLNWGITRTQKSIQIVKCRAPWIEVYPSM